MPTPAKNLPALTLALLALLVSGCAHNSSPPVLRPAEVPPLPPQARQPAKPPICSTTCSDGLTKLRTKSLDSLTSPTPPAQPANAPTTR